jgi:hypothetical protein
MPLQIRRGTTAERLSITPLVSELVYDTTTKLVYVGDGVTAGGVAIDQDSSPNLPLGQISDVVLDNVTDGDILKYNGDDWVNSQLAFATLPGVEINDPEVNQVLKFNGTSWSNENEDSSIVVSALDDLTNVEITNVTSEQLIKWNGTAWVNANINLNQTVTTDIIPGTGLNGDLDIGSSTLKFNSAYFAGEISTEDTIRSLRSVTSRIESLAAPTNSELRIVNEASQGQIFIQGNSNINIKVVGAESRLIVGSTAQLETSSGLVDIVSTTVPSSGRYGFSLMHHHTNTDIQNFNIIRTRGDVVNWGTVQADDVLGRIVFWGASATDFGIASKLINPAAFIEVQNTSTPIDGGVPGKIIFGTADVGQPFPVGKAELSSNGTWKVDKLESYSSNASLSLMSIPKLPTFADEVTANASVNNTPENGMMYYDSGASKVKAYQGGAWVVLA